MGLLLTVFFLAIPLIAIIQVDHSAHAIQTTESEFVAFLICAYGFWFHLWGWVGGVFARVQSRPQAPLPPARLG